MSKATRNLIISAPHSNLRKTSKKVVNITPKILQIIEDMKNATLDWEDNRQHELGVALAAIQIDKPWRVIIVRENFEDKNNRNFLVLINPTITKLEGKMVKEYEGCLSVTDIYGSVPRYDKARIQALDINGNKIKMKVEGFLSRVLQHEIDHLNGKLFIDHIKGNRNSFFKIDKNGQLIKADYDKEIKQSDIFRQ